MSDLATATQLRRGVIGPCILAALSTGRRYGLQLVKELERDGKLLTSQGTIYPLLNRLQEAGLVRSEWEIVHNERPRRYYELTDAGRKDLQQFQTDWTAFTATVDALLATVGRGANNG